MAVKFNSSGGGSVTLDAPSTASNLTVTLPSASGTLVSTGSPFSGGTANGVLYLNGSSVPTTGSALTFDGTNLGVGTTSPTRLVQAQNTSGNPFISIYGGASSIGGLLFDKAAGAYGQIRYDNSTDNMWFTVANTEQMRLTSTGLGIGTSSPGYKLHVQGNGFFNGTLQCTGTFYTTGSLISSNSGANPLTFGINDAEKMRIDTSGNVGIGTSSPSYPLQVSTSSTGVAFQTVRGGNYLSVGGMGSGTIYAKGYESVVAFGNVFAGATTFLTNDTERMRIDSNGTLLLGTTSALGQKMTVAGATTTALDSYGQVAVLASDSVAADKGGQIMMGAYYSGTNYAAYGGISAKKENATSGNYAGYLQFIVSSYPTGNVERMRIDSSGNLLVGTSSTVLSGLTASVQVGSNTPAANAFNKSPVVNNVYSTAAGVPNFTWNAPGPYCGIGSHSSSTSSPVRIGTVSATVGSGFYWSGGYPDLFSGAYTNASDYRLKENVQNYSNGALAQVSAMRPVTYKMKDVVAIKDGKDIAIIGKNSIGFIAHEMQQIVPMLVTGIKDGPEDQGIDYAKLTTVLVKAIQELKAELDATKAEVAALKGAK